MSNSAALALATSPDTERLVDPFESATSVDQLESAIRDNLVLLDIDAMTFHHFALGTYARELRIPAGVLLTGKIHKTRHLNIISAGRISVWSELEGVKHITAPYTFVAEPGTRRVGYAHEDTIWTTVHATSETDLAVIEAQFIEPHRTDDAEQAVISTDALAAKGGV